jgi:catechol 2,3-dioxygenase-like lactoylglutathione lyase family enzyme
MSAPALLGLHHFKLPVSDLDASIDWYGRVFGAQYLPQFDHVDSGGVRYAVILDVPGLPAPVELRWAPQAAGAIRGYDPIDLAVNSVEALHEWIDHLDRLSVDHSPVITGGAGHLMVLADPDRIFIRIAEVPVGGVADIKMPDGDPEPDDLWLKPPSMQHP